MDGDVGVDESRVRVQLGDCRRRDGHGKSDPRCLTVRRPSPRPARWWPPSGRLSQFSPLAQLVVEAVVPLKVTEPEEPKLEPWMVTLESTSPEFGSSLEIVGAGMVTVKVTPVLDCPPAVTTTGPVVAPVGTLV